MSRFLFIFAFIFVLVVPAETVLARTVVTRTPYYNPAFRNYGHNNYRNRNFYNRPRYYNSRPVYKPISPYRTNRIYNRHASSNFSDLSALEKYTFNRSYGRESDLDRLQRLEMQTFGAIQAGDINTRYDRVRNAILARPKQNYRTSWFRNIGNFFGGQLTGFTPSFDSSFDNDPFFSSSAFSGIPYPSSYGNSSVSQFSGPYGSGYRLNNYGTGSTSGVRILD